MTTGSRIYEVISIDQPQHHIHLGRSYSVGHMDESVGENTNIAVLIRIPSNVVIVAHFTGTVTGNAKAEP